MATKQTEIQNLVAKLAEEKLKSVGGSAAAALRGPSKAEVDKLYGLDAANGRERGWVGRDSRRRLGSPTATDRLQQEEQHAVAARPQGQGGAVHQAGGELPRIPAGNGSVGS